MNIFGNNLKVSLFGASHEAYIGITILGYPAGILLDTNKIDDKLKLRRGLNNLTSKRYEEDHYEIVSGVVNGYTTGSPITFLIENKDVKSADYEKMKAIARPSHADYTYYQKYHGFNDYRGGGTSSGRLTVALIVLGAISEQLLESKNIIVASRIKSVYTIEDDNNLLVDDNTLKAWQKETFPVGNNTTKEKMKELIKEVSLNKDSVGAIVETYVKNLEVGVGEPFFDSLESVISHLIFSIPGVKGIEFGDGFDITKKLGSIANDSMQYHGDLLEYNTNNSGGINGGISNGNIIVFKTAFKPTPSIGLPQKTVDFKSKTNTNLTIEGRHDSIIAIKGLHVVNAITNYAILDLFMENHKWIS